MADDPYTNPEQLVLRRCWACGAMLEKDRKLVDAIAARNLELMKEGKLDLPEDVVALIEDGTKS